MIKELLFLLVVFAAHVIQTLTGFAGTMLAMPLSIRLIGMDSARAALNIVAMLVSLEVLVKSYRDINVKEAAKIIVLMLLGMAVSEQLMDAVPREILLYVYGGLIIAVALKKLFVKKELRLPPFVMLLIIFCAGIIHGLFVSGGSLLVIYAVTVLKDRKSFRATMAVIWLVLNSFLVYSHVSSGYYTPHTVKLILAAAAVAVLSFRVGNRLFDRIDQKLFLKISYVLLLISGVTLFI